jgi:hypothetical protein
MFSPTNFANAHEHLYNENSLLLSQKTVISFLYNKLGGKHQGYKPWVSMRPNYVVHLGKVLELLTNITTVKWTN